MFRGLLVMFVVWVFVSLGILVFAHLSNRDKGNSVKAVIYVFITAVISGLAILAVVQIF